MRKRYWEGLSHPHSRYGEIIDYDGIRKGAKKGKLRGPPADSDFHRRKAVKSITERVGVGVRNAARIACLDMAAHVVAVLNVINGMSFEEAHERSKDHRLAGRVKQ